ncbi:MAG: hypothetical protein Q9176_005325 [Flavoplaca citrina]
MKVKKIKPASNRAPWYLNQVPSSPVKRGGRFQDSLLRGACASSRLGATVSVVGATISRLEIKTTAIKRPPVAANRTSASKKMQSDEEREESAKFWLLELLISPPLIFAPLAME